MVEVIRGIRSRGRFQLLRRFIAHGSLLPSWESRLVDATGALRESELVACIDFISGHMVSKFQGMLAEILASTCVHQVVAQLARDGLTPDGAELVWGNRVRCRPLRARFGPDVTRQRGVLGPDALLVSRSGGSLHLHAVIEVKSMQLSDAKLIRQAAQHVAALDRGVAIDGIWGPCAPVDRDRLKLFIVLPHDGGMARASNGPGERTLTDRARLLLLPWSRSALRAAAFGLVHRFMAEVGTSLARQPEAGFALRDDMTPEAAGENDFLHQLHVAIVRQASCERNVSRRQRLIDLYNVLSFGWEVGHDCRDADGEVVMMYPEDAERRQQSACSRLPRSVASPILARASEPGISRASARCAVPRGGRTSCGLRRAGLLDSLPAIVSSYVADYRLRALAERQFYARHATWETLLDSVAAARDMYGRRHSHQRRLARDALVTVRSALAGADLRGATSFADLIGRVEAAIGSIYGVGELMVYDTALRLGASVGLEPEVVYLHSGTRKGARALGLDHAKPFLAMDDLPSALRGLRPREVEDLLCIYKAQLLRVGRQG